MKKHIKKIMGMGLACMLFLGVPFQASAAEVTGTLSTETSGEDGAADGADNSSDAAAIRTVEQTAARRMPEQLQITRQQPMTKQMTML